MDWGERLARIIRDSGKSDVTIARRAQVGLQTIRNWKAGRTQHASVDKLARVAQELQFSLDELFDLRPAAAHVPTHTAAEMLELIAQALHRFAAAERQAGGPPSAMLDGAEARLNQGAPPSRQPGPRGKRRRSAGADD